MSTVYIAKKGPNESISVLKGPDTDSSTSLDIAPLGHPGEERRFWFQRGKGYNPEAVATQPSVYDNPDTAKEYQPRADWENLHRFDPSARWTWSEEYKLIRKIDLRIMVFTCLMFMCLELDRSNLSQALTDNMLPELNMNTNGKRRIRVLFSSYDIPGLTTVHCLFRLQSWKYGVQTRIPLRRASFPTRQ